MSTNEVDKIVKQMKEGKTLKELAFKYPKAYCRFKRGLQDIELSLIMSRTEEFRNVEVILLTGPTGCGKTRTAIESSKDYYMTYGCGMWWDKYNQQKTLIIDQYNNDIPIRELCSLLDGYQLRLNVRYSHTYANWNKVYITTLLKVDKIHEKAKPDDRKALFNRITTIVDTWPKK
jgi:DNA polymerase III delta prime subunit